MLKIFLLRNSHTPLADEQSEILESIELNSKLNGLINCNCTMEEADAMVIQEKNTWKTFRYVTILKNDPVFKKYAHKIFTINKDTRATGLLRGLYYSLPKRKYNSGLYSIVPYFTLNNELMLQGPAETAPNFLACWRGSTKTNKMREKLVEIFCHDPDFDIQTTATRFYHSQEEKELFRSVMQNAKFSLCPAGIAANSFRIYESMAIGKCPVIIADEYVPPNVPGWATFSITVPEKEIKNLKQFLIKQEADYKIMGEKAYQAWEHFFSPQNISHYYTNQLIKLIGTTTPSTVEAEFKRWKAFSMFYNNKWTIAHRVLHKMQWMFQIYIIQDRSFKTKEMKEI